MSKRLIKEIAVDVLTATGAHRLLERLRAPGRLAILMYHGVTRRPLPVADWCFVAEADFRAQMAYLKRHCEVLPLVEAVARLQRGEARRPTVAITFDDGYQNNCDVAWPILREAGLPATIFLNTAFIGADRTLWFCRLNQALATSPRRQVEFNGTRYDLSGDRAAVSAQLQAALKQLPQARLLEATQSILTELGAPEEAPVAADSPYRFLDPSSIARMNEDPLIEFGAHTHHHAILSLLDPAEQAREIATSIQRVAELTGRPCRSFAYPNGRPQDYDGHSMAALRERGVEIAVTTSEHPNDARTPTLELGRYGIGADMSPALFQFTTHHGPAILRGAA